MAGAVRYRHFGGSESRITGPSKWLWWFAAKITGPSIFSRCSSPATVMLAKIRLRGRIHVGRLTRRATRASRLRFHDGNVRSPLVPAEAPEGLRLVPPKPRCEEVGGEGG